jgi:hypothetical protein
MLQKELKRDRDSKERHHALCPIPSEGLIGADTRIGGTGSKPAVPPR